MTDPTYGIDSHYQGGLADSGIGSSDVYRIDPATGETAAMVTDMRRPNGSAFAPDEATLHVSETGTSHDPSATSAIRAHPIGAGGAPGAGHVFAETPGGLLDGFRVAREGKVGPPRPSASSSSLPTAPISALSRWPSSSLTSPSADPTESALCHHADLALRLLRPRPPRRPGVAAARGDPRPAGVRLRDGAD